MKSRKGFTLLEAIVALAAIVIFTGTALMIIDLANNISGNSLLRVDSASFVKSVYDLYKAADNQDELTEMIEACEEAMGFSCKTSGSLYEIEKGILEIRITASKQRDYFSATVYNTDTNRVLYEYFTPEVEMP